MQKYFETLRYTLTNEMGSKNELFLNDAQCFWVISM